MKIKVISFSLWGNNTRYTMGALQNASLAKIVYPDWICRFYVGQSTSSEIKTALSEYDNVQLIEMNEPGDWTGMFWRFYPAGDDDVEVMISRDVDSRLWFREKDAVDEWLSSDKDFHIMRDHHCHGVPILGGMWGARGNVIKEIKTMCDNYSKGNFWQVDQNFLAQVIFPLVKHNSFIHDEQVYPENPFRIARNNKHFIGQAYAGCGRILDSDEYFQDYMREEYESSR